MDLQLSPELAAFRDEVRAFVRENLPEDTREKVRNGLKLHKDDYVRWQKILARKGWVASTWPKEYGGPGWSPAERYLFEEECAAGYAPRLIAFGLRMVGPVIYTFGSEAQKKRFLPRILNSDDFWCQGYSEPGAGSDLASLQTRAVREGDHYIVNGQKTWTTMAQWADWIFCLVRTDTKAKVQEGISFLLVDMKSPGVEVKPIVTLEGGTEINSVYLTDVKVPVDNRVGEENQGWTYAKFLLGNERLGIARVGASKAQLERLKAIAAKERARGRTLIEDPDFRREIAEVQIALQALEYTELRLLMAAEGGREPGPEASLLKIRGTDIQQRISELLMKSLGYYANPFVPEAFEYGWNETPVGPEYGPTLASYYFNLRKTSIYGGTNEIQRNIMAKMVLGL